MFGGPSVNATRCGVDLWPNLPASLNGTFGLGPPVHDQLVLGRAFRGVLALSLGSRLHGSGQDPDYLSGRRSLLHADKRCPPPGRCAGP